MTRLLTTLLIALLPLAIKADEPNCVDVKDGTVFPVPGFCNLYYECEDDFTDLHACYGLKLFNPVTLKCEEAAGVKCI